MEKRYKCANGMVERTRFFVGDNTRISNRWRRTNKEWKQEQNLQSCVRKVARILHCNYTHDNGLLITLDLHEEGLGKLMAALSQEHQEILTAIRCPVGEIGTWSTVGKKKTKDSACDVGKKEEQGKTVQEALAALRMAMDHQLTLWLRRVKRKHEGQIKALMVVSDMDHETGELVRCHCHIVLAAEDISWDLLRKEWKLGTVDIRQLRKQRDYTPIAVYLMKQVRRQPDKKKYRVTQGMKQPEVEVKMVTGRTEMSVPPGAYVLERSEYREDTLGQYIRYIPKQTKSADSKSSKKGRDQT